MTMMRKPQLPDLAKQNGAFCTCTTVLYKKRKFTTVQLNLGWVRGPLPRFADQYNGCTEDTKSRLFPPENTTFYATNVKRLYLHSINPT